MTRVPTGWSGKTLMWLLVCLLAIATSDDFWSIAMASPSSELLIVDDDTDTDSSTKRMPACVSGSVGHTDLCSFVRKAAHAVESVNLQNVPYLQQRTPRGPPDDKLHDRALSESPCFSPAAVDAAFVIVFSLLADISCTSLEIKPSGALAQPLLPLLRSRWSGIAQRAGRPECVAVSGFGPDRNCEHGFDDAGKGRALRAVGSVRRARR